MARSDPQINFRIPQELKDALDEASAENRRSLTAEVVARLHASFDQPSASMAVTHTADTTLSTILAELERLFDEKLGHQQKAYIDSAEGGRMQDVKIVKKRGKP